MQRLRQLKAEQFRRSRRGEDTTALLAEIDRLIQETGYAEEIALPED